MTSLSRSRPLGCRLKAKYPGVSVAGTPTIRYSQRDRRMLRPLSHQSQAENGGSLWHRRVEHDLAGDLARFHQPVRLGGLRERHDALDLWLDLALNRCREALRQIGWLIARPADDGDLVVIEVREIDGHVRPAMGASGHQPSAEAERHEGLRHHFRVGDVV